MQLCIGSQFLPTVCLAHSVWGIKFKDTELGLDLSGSRDVIHHVTIGLAMCSFLLVVGIN